MKIYTTYSSTTFNIYSGIGAKKWGFSKPQNSHGGISPGEKFLVACKKEKIEKTYLVAIGNILSYPKIGSEEKYVWKDGTYYDCFKISFTHKGEISKDNLKKIFGESWDKKLKARLLNVHSEITPDQFLDLTSELEPI